MTGQQWNSLPWGCLQTGKTGSWTGQPPREGDVARSPLHEWPSRQTRACPQSCSHGWSRGGLMPHLPPTPASNNVWGKETIWRGPLYIGETQERFWREWISADEKCLRNSSVPHLLFHLFLLSAQSPAQVSSQISSSSAILLVRVCLGCHDTLSPFLANTDLTSHT